MAGKEPAVRVRTLRVVLSCYTTDKESMAR